MIQKKTTYRWFIFSFFWYVLMFILIPPKKGPKISPFGFYLGFVQAVLLNFIAVKKYKLWKLPGDILYKGIPLLTSLSWIPPSIVYAYYYPYHEKFRWKSAYTMLFAVGTAIVQYVQGLVGMWESKNWRPIYTLPLALLTHTIMALCLPLFKLDHIREKP